MENDIAIRQNNQPDHLFILKNQSEFMQKAGRSINTISLIILESLLSRCEGGSNILPDNEIASLLEAIDLISMNLCDKAEN